MRLSLIHNYSVKSYLNKYSKILAHFGYQKLRYNCFIGNMDRAKGAFTNYVYKRREVGGQKN